MRELERDDLPSPLKTPLALVGRGRVGRSLARAAEAAGIEVTLLPGDGAGPFDDAAVLLCVPDDAISETAALVAESSPALIGHVSGASTLDVLATAADAGAGRFSLHPLQTFPSGETTVEGTPAAIAGSDPDSLEYAHALATALRMHPFEVPEGSRAAYHAAAALASNLLVALEESAAEVLERIGVQDARALLAPIVLRTTSNWVELGPAALTGPIARGDRATVQRHRIALAESAPELVRIYDALAMRAEAVAWELMRGGSASEAEEPPVKWRASP